MSDNFYRAFEDRYRGSREVIMERLRAYLPFLEPLVAAYPQGRALDLGCGRGEWLELTSSLGFDAHGVDLDDGMLAACSARGLQAERGDALSALRAEADGSLALVSAFHLVEHIPFDDVRTLIAEARRALVPGGLLVLETPNPENLVVGASTFYSDPSHLRPVPLELLSFAVEYAGFPRRSLMRLQEDPALRGRADVTVADVLRGASPDYSVVGQKDGPAELLAGFDEAFGRHYGIAMHDLASRQEATQARHLEQTHARIAQVDARFPSVLDELEHQRQHIAELRQANHELDKAIHWLDGRLAASDARADAMAQRVIDLLESTSWKVTEPLRAAADRWYRLRAAVREGRVGAAVKRRVLRVVVAGGRVVLRNPAAKRASRRVLRAFPSVEEKLRRAMFQAPVVTMPTAAPPSDISPRTSRMMAALRAAQQEHGAAAVKHAPDQAQPGLTAAPATVQQSSAAASTHAAEPGPVSAIQTSHAAQQEQPKA